MPLVAFDFYQHTFGTILILIIAACVIFVVYTIIKEGSESDNWFYNLIAFIFKIGALILFVRACGCMNDIYFLCPT